MRKAIDALENSVQGLEDVAPNYWKNASKVFEKKIDEEVKKGKTHIKARLKTAYFPYCRDQLKELGYKVETITQDEENTQVLIDWSKEVL